MGMVSTMSKSSKKNNPFKRRSREEMQAPKPAKFVLSDEAKAYRKDKLFALKMKRGWYVEDTDSLAIPYTKPQVSLVRVFPSFDQAEQYLAAVEPYMGKMEVYQTSDQELLSDLVSLNEFSMSQFDSPVDIMYCTISPYEWPKEVVTLISHQEIPDWQY